MKRFVGYAIIAACWATLCGLMFFFGAAYAIYADLKSPVQSRLTAGTHAEVLAHAVFNRRFRPIWQSDPACAQFDPQLTYVPKSGAVRFHGREFDTTITMLPEGPRQQPSGLPPRGERIVVLGDSFAMGWGVNDAETFSAVLAARHGHPTVNIGVSSYGTPRELLRLRQLGLADGAAHFIVQFCANDDRENREFLRDPAAFVAQRDTAAVWREIQGQRWSELSYGAVLGTTLEILQSRAKADGLPSVARALFTEKILPFGRAPRMRDDRAAALVARDFVAIWDAFPELAGKPVIVTEMNPNGVDSGVLAALEEHVRARPNFKVVRLKLLPEEYYRFDSHLTVAGHVSAAAQLDRAIWEHRAALAQAPR